MNDFTGAIGEREVSITDPIERCGGRDGRPEVVQMPPQPGHEVGAAPAVREVLACLSDLVGIG
jgi:hypothetical protein